MAAHAIADSLNELKAYGNLWRQEVCRMTQFVWKYLKISSQFLDGQSARTHMRPNKFNDVVTIALIATAFFVGHFLLQNIVIMVTSRENIFCINELG